MKFASQRNAAIWGAFWIGVFAFGDRPARAQAPQPTSPGQTTVHPTLPVPSGSPSAQTLPAASTQPSPGESTQALPAPSTDSTQPLPSAPPPQPSNPHDAAVAEALRQVALGDHAAAARILRQELYLANYDKNVQPAFISYVGEQYQKLREKVAIVSINATRGAEVKLGNTPLGLSPIYDEQIVNPGKYRVRAEGKNCLGIADFTAVAGQSETVKVSCETIFAWRNPVAITGGILSVLAIGVGIGTLVTAEANREGLNDLREEARSYGFVDTSIEFRARETEQRRVDLLNASVTSFLIGGSLGLLSGGLFIFVKPQKPSEPPPLVGFSAGLGFGTFAVRF